MLFAEGSSEIETSTVVGSSCSKNFSIQNIKDFAVRAVIDLREFPELDIKLNTVVVEVTGLGFRKQHGLASRRASTIGGASLGLPQHQLLPQQQPRSSSSNLMVASIGSGINQRGGSSSNLLVANNSMTPAIAPRPQTVRALDKNEIAKKNSRISLIKPGDELYRFEVKAAENAFMRLSNSGARKEEWLMSNTDFPNLFTANEKYSSGGVGGGNIFIIDVNPDECMDLQLVFKPRQVKQYSLDIPVRCLGGNINHILHLETNAISSPITLSKNAIDFQNRVLVKDFNAMMNGEDAKEIVHIENKSGTTMKWSFDTAVIEQRGNVFRIEPTQGTLFPDQTQALCVFFKPDNTGPVSSEVHLYVESLGFKSPVSLQLKGTGVEPSLAFDPPEIILPFIPAGGEITSVFSIVNYGCDRTEIRFNIPQEPLSKYGNLELSFPEGRLLKGDGEKLAVIVKYTSNVKDAGGAKDIKNNSTSFAIKVEFLNQISQTFYLPIRGTSDSSLLTLQPYLWSNRQTHSFSLSEDSRFIHYQPIVPLTEVAEKDKRYGRRGDERAGDELDA